MIEYNFSVKASWEELRGLSPEQCEAFMLGVAEVVSANPYQPIEVAEWIATDPPQPIQEQ